VEVSCVPFFREKTQQEEGAAIQGIAPPKNPGVSPAKRPTARASGTRLSGWRRERWAFESLEAWLPFNVAEKPFAVPKNRSIQREGASQRSEALGLISTPLSTQKSI